MQTCIFMHLFTCEKLSDELQNYLKLKNEQNYSDALSKLKILLKYSPNSNEFNIENIQILLKLNEIDTAKLELKKVEKSDFIQNYELLFLRGLINFYQGNE